uniref:Uncharacterized protein n=1 Tax=Romanomermis culicivorax TaxID=13658 RepID=A0A915JWN0_ROMCU
MYSTLSDGFPGQTWVLQMARKWVR